MRVTPGASHDAHRYPAWVSKTKAPLPGLTVAPGPRPGIPDAGMQCSDDPIPRTRLKVLAGTLPAGIGGSVFLSGPKATVGQPIWGSEAVIWRFDFDEGGVAINKEFARNPQWWASKAIEDDGFFAGLRKSCFAFKDVGAGFFMSALLGVQDMQNIAPIPLSPRLMMVTSDNGRPWILDPDSLDVVRPMGDRVDWKPGMNLPWPFGMYVTTAHPVLDRPQDPDRSVPPIEDFPDTVPASDVTEAPRHVYSTNFMPKAPVIPGFTHLIRWDVQTTEMEHFRLIDQASGEPLVIDETLHQLQVTQNHVVLLESAFQVNFWLLALNFLTNFGVPSWVIDALTSNPDYPYARFWVIDKNALKKGGTPDNPVDIEAKPIPIAGESWHFAAPYDDSKGLHLFVLHTPTADISHYIGKGQKMLDGSTARPELDGFFTNYGLRPAELGLHTVDVEAGTVKSAWVANEDHTWGLGVHAYRYQARPWLAREMPRVFMTSGGFYRGGVPQSFYNLYKARAPRVDELPTCQPGSVFALDAKTLSIDGWELPQGWFTFTPTYMPPVTWTKGAYVEDHDKPDGDGHLFVVAISDPTAELPEGSSGTEVWIFEAGDLAKGPVCRLGLPDLKVGVTVHSCWVGTTETFGSGPPWDVEKDFDLDDIEAAYQSVIPDWVPLSGLWKKGVSRYVKMKEIRSMFREKIYPRFKGQD